MSPPTPAELPSRPPTRAVFVASFQLPAKILPRGRTRLEGSTWYELEVHPGLCWSRWSDGFFSALHHRVLGHIARLADAVVAGSPR